MLWDCYGIAMGFRNRFIFNFERFEWDFYGISMGCPWDVHRISMGFQKNLGIFKGLLWWFYDMPTLFLRYFHGIAMIFHFFYGYSMEFYRIDMGFSMVFSMGLLRGFLNFFLRFLKDFYRISIVFLWNPSDFYDMSKGYLSRLTRVEHFSYLSRFLFMNDLIESKWISIEVPTYP